MGKHDRRRDMEKRMQDLSLLLIIIAGIALLGLLVDGVVAHIIATGG